MSYFSDIWSLEGEKSQKKLGEIQKKKFHPVISGAFFLQIIFNSVMGLFCKMRYQPLLLFLLLISITPFLQHPEEWNGKSSSPILSATIGGY
jgi:hypothetical protein